MKIPAIVPLIAAALLAGCASPISYTPLDNPGTSSSYPPVDPADVRIYLVKGPDRPYVEMGLLSLSSGYSPSDKAEIFERFRRKAAEIGADGIIMMPETSGTNLYPQVGYDYWGNPIVYNSARSVYNFTATAIRLK